MSTGIVGEYRYTASFAGDMRYAIIRNGGVLERIRRVEAGGNPVIWAAPDAPTDEALEALANERA